MKRTVFVPTMARQELLFCCLEAVRKADREIEIVVSPDRGSNERDICQRFNARHRWTIPHTLHGNTYNMMSGLKELYEAGYQLVHVIEDDCVIEPTAFEWAYKALEKFPEAFAACGWRYSPDAIIGDGPDMLLAWYLSVFSTLPRKALQAIAQHARPEYFVNMRQYLDLAFPQSRQRGSQHYEQDGAILRIVEAQSKRCVWPRRPRATHCGYHGYHQPGKPLQGTLEERVYLVKLAIKKPKVLAALMNGGTNLRLSKCRSCDDPVAVDRDDLTAVCSTCFHTAYPNLVIASDSHYYLHDGSLR
jgi:hypothetical protein